MIEAALSSEADGKLATSIPGNVSATAVSSATTLQTPVAVTVTDNKATSATAGVSGSGIAESSGNINLDKTSRFSVIPLVGLGLFFLWD